MGDGEDVYMLMHKGHNENKSNQCMKTEAVPNFTCLH